MLLNKIIINKKFITILWFRYIFLTYNYMYFYNLDIVLLNQENYKKILNLINMSRNLISSRSLFSLRGLFVDKPFFNFLDNNFLILQSNNFYILPELDNNSHFILQAISYKGFFIKNCYIKKIFKYNNFYQKNYLFIKNYYLFFLSNFFNIILNLKKILLLNLILLSKTLDDNINIKLVAIGGTLNTNNKVS